MVDDNELEIVSADDYCPFCNSAMIDHGKYAGIWDGSLGQGCGNFYIAQCSNCGADLIGWEYLSESDSDVTHILWEGRVSNSRDS